jgi:GH25 family lysozyme M1 (1,4-beta-N-acetylmuramidase)
MIYSMYICRIIYLYIMKLFNAKLLLYSLSIIFFYSSTCFSMTNSANNFLSKESGQAISSLATEKKNKKKKNKHRVNSKVLNPTSEETQGKKILYYFLKSYIH